MQYTEHFSTKQTPQSQPIPDKDMVVSNAGGFVFKVDSWVQFQRFLILGSEGGTYYVKEQKLTVENAKNTIACIKQDGLRALAGVLAISENGRAAKNSPAIFALALAATFGDQNTKNAAYKAIPKVCRTGTHLFEFCQAIQDLRGWSRGLRKGISKWYLEKENNDLSYQLIKYQQRNGWTHKDVLRLSHPKTKNEIKNSHLKWAVGKSQEQLYQHVEALESLKKEKDFEVQRKLIVTHNLPREAIPTELLKNPKVWDAMFPKMPLTAMIRNLGTMTANGLLKTNLDDSVRTITQKLNPEALRKSRVHPITILVALKTYAQGHGFKGKLKWSPVTKIIDALDEAFYESFSNVEPTDKNFLLGLDVSGSMDNPIMGTPLSAREATSAMAMVTARTERAHEIVAFSDTLVKLNISPKQRLDDICRLTRGLPFSCTDCSIPMLYAAHVKMPIDVFVIYTDNETWAGRVHPKQALDQYRQKMGKDAKCIVVGTTATGFTIADPSDPGMLDVVGFDSNIPEVIKNFVI